MEDWEFPIRTGFDKADFRAFQSELDAAYEKMRKVR